MKLQLTDLEHETIEMLRNQNRELLEQLATAQEFMATFPQQIMSARLDAKEGIETKYNYAKHGKIMNFSGGPVAIRNSIN